MSLYRDLLNLGYSVFPVASGGKRPLVKWEEFQSRLAFEREIFWWGRQFKDANVGIATGAVSGIVVLDIDSREGYEEAQRRGLPKTPCVVTGKGIHYYFKHPGIDVRNFASKLPGIDLRGDGGYVVAPGSYHAESGRHYDWKVHPESTPYASLPWWLVKLIEEKPQADPEMVDNVAQMLDTKIRHVTDSSKYGLKAFTEEVAILSGAREGSRNNTLFKVAVRMFELAKANEVPMSAVHDTIWEIATGVGLGKGEIQKTIESALKISKPKPKPTTDA